MTKVLKTSDISRATGVHTNTVRLYEEWGFLPPIPRSSSGYRLFSECHLQQMRLARLAFADPYAGSRIRRSAREMVRTAAAGELDLAHRQAELHQVLVRSELEQTCAAAHYLNRWAAGLIQDHPSAPFHNRTGAARLLDVTAETLRHWERNGLICIPRNQENNYRQYGPAEIDRLRVIRLLSRAGYSTMAILRMVKQLDQGRREDLGLLLDTPDPEEDLLHASDRWLSTLTSYEKRTTEILAQLDKMILHYG